MVGSRVAPWISPRGLRRRLERRAMELRLTGQRFANPLRVSRRFLLCDVNRPVERKRDLFKHSAQQKLSVLLRPEMRNRSAGFNEPQVLAVGHLVFLHSELRDFSGVLVIFVVPSERSVAPFAEHRPSCWNITPLLGPAPLNGTSWFVSRGGIDLHFIA